MTLTASTGYRKPGFIFALCIVLALQGCAEAVVVGGMGGLVAMNDARSTKDWYQDQTLEKAARRILYRDPQLKDHSDITITSFNRTLLLTGQTRTRALKQHATSLLRKLDNVRLVRNELLVASPPMENSWASDSYMTARVKARLVFRDFDATRIKVISDLGNVYLMGRVSHEESDQVTAMVADVGGVSTVTGVFEYVD